MSVIEIVPAPEFVIAQVHDNVRMRLISQLTKENYQNVTRKLTKLLLLSKASSLMLFE